MDLSIENRRISGVELTGLELGPGLAHPTVMRFSCEITLGAIDGSFSGPRTMIQTGVSVSMHDSLEACERAALTRVAEILARLGALSAEELEEKLQETRSRSADLIAERSSPGSLR